ncbi:hypothetical protein PRIC1_003920 [Phytophthora ramorum]
MAPVAAWTKEWRPLAKQLCAHISDTHTPDEGAKRPLPQEALLLRADRVVGQFYSHRFVDTLPQDVQQQTEALATKFRVHSLEDRADKLLQLSPHCDCQVLKLLLELATSPTTAVDEDVDVDEDADSRWKTVLQQEQLKQKQHRQMQDQLVDELFQISTNDEWYQAWEESDEESDWEMSSVGRERSVDSCHRNGKRTSEALEEEGDAIGGQEVMPLPDSRVSSVLASGDSAEHGGTRREFSEGERLRDNVLCRYHPEVLLRNEEDMVVDDAEDPTCVMEKSEHVPFTLDRPWLLCEAVVKSAEGGWTTSGIIPRRLIHEQTVVSMVFEALDGIDSLLFEFRPVKPTPLIFSLDFQTMTVERSRQSLGVAVGHLSPLAFHHVVSEFAQAASELQLLRDLLGFIRHAPDLSEQHRCVTLEGLANSLSEVIGNVNDSIRKVELQVNTAVNLEDEDPSPWSGIASRQPTLLGIYGGLKEIFLMISWLKRVLIECFQGLSERHWHGVKRAERAKCVLDALYRMMELEILERCLTQHIESKCQGLNSEITDIFRDEMCYMEHVDALRMLVLMGQQDVFSVFTEKLVAHMQSNPVAWADSEKLNVFHQSAVQGVFENNSLSPSQRQIGGRLRVRVDFSLLDSASSSARIDIATMKCMHFTFAAQQPLRVLFSASIMQKYSRLGVFLVQVKAVESALVKFKSTLRHRRCYSFIEQDMRQLLVQMADMLHFTKSLLSYLTSQVSSQGWSKYRQVMLSSRSLGEMDATHEQYLDDLLNRFFLLDKHATVIQYILTTFNHILRFVGQGDEFVSTVDRNMHTYFPESKQAMDQVGDKLLSARLLDRPDFRVLHAEMTRSSKEFKRQSHFLVVMLTAMQKHGASPHVTEIVMQLNYNYFYHQQERQSRAHVPIQQSQQIKPANQAPPFKRSGSLHPPPAPKKFSRTRSVHLP